MTINPDEVTKDTLLDVIQILSRYIDWSKVAEEDKPFLQIFVTVITNRPTTSILDIGY